MIVLVMSTDGDVVHISKYGFELFCFDDVIYDSLECSSTVGYSERKSSELVKFVA